MAVVVALITFLITVVAFGAASSNARLDRHRDYICSIEPAMKDCKDSPQVRILQLEQELAKLKQQQEGR